MRRKQTKKIKICAWKNIYYTEEVISKFSIIKVKRFFVSM
jgi:hypothetical protein